MRRIGQVTAASLLIVVLAAPAPAQPGTVEQVTVQGLYRMTRAAFLHAFGIREGDPYDPERIRRQFRVLWDMKLFEDITIEAETGPQGGKVLVIKVVERPVLSAVTYEDNKVVTQTQIEDTLREREIRLGLGKPLDPKQIADAEAAIRDLLAQRGHLDSVVTGRVDIVTERSRAVTFSIQPGRKTRIRSIRFTGNEVFKDKALKKQLKLTSAWNWYWPWSKKNLYHPLRWDQDVGGVRDLYQDNGYLDIEVRAPFVEIREPKSAAKAKARGGQGASADAEPPVPKVIVRALQKFDARLERAGLSPRKQRKLERRRDRLEQLALKKQEKARGKGEGRQWVFLTVPVKEGSQYRLGEIRASGNNVIGDREILGNIPLRKGDVLRNNLLELGIDRITRRYEDRGHLYASVVRRINRRENETVADVEIAIDEDRPYYVERIEFAGNGNTQDRVLRRELLINEGELFNRTKLDLSRIKLNQLGYWAVPDDAVIEPVEGENRVRVTFAGEERGRNEIQVGGGYSGLDGAFFSGIYSTRNFLGRGQVLSTALQIGGRANRYSLSFTEPWFLNRPYTLGFRLFRQDVDFGASLKSSSKGGGVLLGKRLRRFASVSLGYNYESVSSTALTRDLAAVSTPLISSTATNTISSLSPAFEFNSINNPYRPSRGKSFLLRAQIAGGPLGGDTSFLKPVASFTGYKRMTRRSFLGMNAQVGLVRSWQGGSPENAANIRGIPRFQRFWLGGDTLGPRVFETRSITPLRYVRLNSAGGIAEVLGDPRFVSLADLLTSGGQPALLEVGGDRFYLFQAEWVYPFNEQVELAFFVDAGDALFEDTSLGFDTVRVSSGLELRFHLPVFPVPLRLIYGWPVRELEQDRTSSFQFSVGRSF